MNNIEQLLATKNNEIWTISPDDSVYDAIKQMSEKSVGALPVVVDNKLIGIISERDYTRKVILKGKTSKATKVKEIMTAKVYHTSPDQPIDECMAVMTKHHFRHLPVIKDDVLIGMVSIGDIVKYVISDQKFKIEQLEQTISWGESY